MIRCSSIMLLNIFFTSFVLQEALFANKLLDANSNPNVKSIDIKSYMEGRNKQIIEKLGLNELKLKEQISNPYAKAAESRKHALKSNSSATRQVMPSSRERHLSQQHENAKRYETSRQSLYQNQLRHSREQILQIIQKNKLREM